MRKKIMNFAAVAAILFLGACSNQDEILKENTESERTITLKASMPDEPTTYVGLEQDGKNIKLTWQTSDVVQVAFVQGTIKEKATPIIYNISADGKTMEFTTPLPLTIDSNQPYDIYGIYGNYSTTAEAGGLSDANPTNVILTRTPGSRGSLERVQNRGDVMLYFEAKNISPTNPVPNITFKHLGSLFAISFNNTQSPTPSAITEARLVGVDGSGNTLTNGSWAYNNAAGGQIYDLVTGEFQNTNTASNYISFSTTQSGAGAFAAGTTTTIWGWYPPIPEQAWPALRLEMTTADGTVILPSTNIKPARATAPVAGKAYHFYARWNGTQLNLTNDQYAPIEN